MRSASCRLPRSRILLISWVTSGELYTGSAISGRCGAGPLRGMSALLLLRAVAAARLLAVAHTLGVQRATDDLVPHARKVLHPAAADQHDRVLLQVVPDAGDVRGDLDLAGQPDARHLPQRRVRLLGRGRVHPRAHTAPLRAPLQRRRLGLARLRLAALADQLLDGGHPSLRLPSTTRRRPHRLSSCLSRPPRSGVSSAYGPRPHSRLAGSCLVPRNAGRPSRTYQGRRAHVEPGHARARGERVLTVRAQVKTRSCGTWWVTPC